MEINYDALQKRAEELVNFPSTGDLELVYRTGRVYRLARFCYSADKIVRYLSYIMHEGKNRFEFVASRTLYLYDEQDAEMFKTLFINCCAAALEYANDVEGRYELPFTVSNAEELVNQSGLSLVYDTFPIEGVCDICDNYFFSLVTYGGGMEVCTSCVDLLKEGEQACPPPLNKGIHFQTVMGRVSIRKHSKKGYKVIAPLLFVEEYPDTYWQSCKQAKQDIRVRAVGLLSKACEQREETF